MRGRIAAPLLLVLGLTGCGLGEDPTGTPPVPAMVVRPPALIVAVGATDTLFAFVTGVATGTDRTMEWSAGDTTIVRLTTLSPPDHALVIGRQTGTTAVIATWRADPTVKATATVTVR